jgi:predicted Zn-dependent peptidase
VIEFERFTLPCGLDVVVHPDPSVPLVAVSVWYRVGSSDEPPHATGRAHLFEHLFKNSQHLPRPHYEILKRAGAVDANASTSSDRTAYHEIVPSNQLDLALWIESDRMGYFLPGLTPERVAAQIAVVLGERRQRYENVAYGAERFAIHEALYPEGHPHRHLTIGLREHIAATTTDDIADWYRTWYVPANAQLVIAGDVDVAEARARVEHWFGSFPRAERPRRPDHAAPTPHAARAVVDDRFASMRRIHRAWPSPAAFASGDAELDVYASVLGASGTGTLWRTLVHERQWAQRVQVWQSSARLGGDFHVVVDLRTGADPEQVRSVLDATIGDPTPITERAVARARTRRDASFLWRLEALGRRTLALQRYLLYLDDPGGITVEQARYQAITADDVRAWAARLGAPVEVETHALRAGPATVVATAEVEEVA